jgi:hypothetical protein
MVPPLVMHILPGTDATITPLVCVRPREGTGVVVVSALSVRLCTQGSKPTLKIGVGRTPSPSDFRFDVA